MSFTSHDVRKMAVCHVCKGLGVKRDAELATKIDADILVSDGPKRWVHPKHLKIEQIEALPQIDIDNIRLNDVSAAVMRKILKSVGIR
jgi:hypothetical protein